MSVVEYKQVTVLDRWSALSSFLTEQDNTEKSLSVE